MKTVKATSDGVWTPTPQSLLETNLAWLMQHAEVDSYDQLYAWSVQYPERYWAAVVERLGIRFEHPYQRVLDLSDGLESPDWFPGAKMNIVESCFSAPADSPAIVFRGEGSELSIITVGELKTMSARVAAGLVRRGFKPGDAVAIMMPMTPECVAIYLGILWAGCVVVSIADSFRSKEVAKRLELSNAVGIFTQDVIRRGGKSHPLYAIVKEADAPRAIVVGDDELTIMRASDCRWSDFLSDAKSVPVVIENQSAPINILFSSGTTGDPKAIPWNHTTPLKCAADAHFHHNVRPGDVLVWPTNIGWMMGPWLIFSSLLNRATMGLYCGVPTGAEFCRFVQDAQTTMLGVVPSLVKTWRATGATEGLDWTSIDLFSSTGECADAGDMRWLMEQAGGRPIIEYCGGTEIGGGYITNVVALPCVAAEFNTPTLGLGMVILNEAGEPSDKGEVFLIPPSIGLSTTLLNKDHHKAYYAGTPQGPGGVQLRRHGDQMQKLPGGGWRAMGRADDTMNLGGIKLSSAEIERVLQPVEGVSETAAIAVAPGGGPSQLVVYVVVAQGSTQDKTTMLANMQAAIRRDLNPLFKIHELVFIDALPRTTSNKVMRRVLRDQFLQPSNLS